MNPGTLIFLVLGLIGLFIYASKAIKKDMKEHFTVIDESQVSNKGKEGLEKLREGTLNLESLLSAFTTPDVNIDRASKFNVGANPTISDFNKQSLPVQQLASPLPAPEPIVSKPPTIVNKTPALPVLTPSSIINMPNTNEGPAPPITISDVQGSILPKSNAKKSITESYRSYKKEKRGKRSKTKVVYVPNECPPMPDMSQYIRKDSIPCWGCNLK